MDGHRWAGGMRGGCSCNVDSNLPVICTVCRLCELLDYRSASGREDQDGKKDDCRAVIVRGKAGG